MSQNNIPHGSDSEAAESLSDEQKIIKLLEVRFRATAFRHYVTDMLKTPNVNNGEYQIPEVITHTVQDGASNIVTLSCHKPWGDVRIAYKEDIGTGVNIYPTTYFKRQYIDFEGGDCMNLFNTDSGSLGFTFKQICEYAGLSKDGNEIADREKFEKFCKENEVILKQDLQRMKNEEESVAHKGDGKIKEEQKSFTKLADKKEANANQPQTTISEIQESVNAKIEQSKDKEAVNLLKILQSRAKMLAVLDAFSDWWGMLANSLNPQLEGDTIVLNAHFTAGSAEFYEKIGGDISVKPGEIMARYYGMQTIQMPVQKLFNTPNGSALEIRYERCLAQKYADVGLTADGQDFADKSSVNGLKERYARLLGVMS